MSYALLCGFDRGFLAWGGHGWMVIQLVNYVPLAAAWNVDLIEIRYCHLKIVERIFAKE
jgi:hypothetical protein